MALKLHEMQLKRYCDMVHEIVTHKRLLTVMIYLRKIPSKLKKPCRVIGNPNYERLMKHWKHTVCIIKHLLGWLVKVYTLVTFLNSGVSL